MVSLQIDDLSSWPIEVLSELNRPEIREVFLQTGSVQEAEGYMGEIGELGRALVQHCERVGVRGFHCGKEPTPGFFASNGLRITNPKQCIVQFLQQYGARFSIDCRKRVDEKFYEWLTWPEQMDARKGTLWYCLAVRDVLEDGCMNFFRYFGGEIIYWPFLGGDQEDQEVLAVLEAIGSPVVVEVHLALSDNANYDDHRLICMLLSNFGSSVNSTFQIVDTDGFTRLPLPPEKIARVWDRDEFFAVHAAQRARQFD